MPARPEAAQPRASVVIPTWNGVELLKPALASLCAQDFTEFETVVVDNGSGDGTVEWLAEAHPEVRVVALPENRGFAAAANAGLQAARGELLVLLNNDVEVEPGWLRALVAAMDGDPGLGSCASLMISYRDRGTIDSAGDELGLLAWSVGHGEPDGPFFRTPREVFSACAGAAVYRRSALDAVGVFDERFFAYLEDVDLGARLQLAGWRCRFVPQAVVYHHGSATAGRIPALKLRLLMRNSLFLFLQYMPPATLALWSPVMLLWPFARALREGQPVGLAFGVLAEVARGARDILARRRQVRRLRRISPREFRARLAPFPGGRRPFTPAADPVQQAGP